MPKKAAGLGRRCCEVDHARGDEIRFGTVVSHMQGGSAFALQECTHVDSQSVT